MTVHAESIHSGKQVRRSVTPSTVAWVGVVAVLFLYVLLLATSADRSVSVEQIVLVAMPAGAGVALVWGVGAIGWMVARRLLRCAARREWWTILPGGLLLLFSYNLYVGYYYLCDDRAGVAARVLIQERLRVDEAGGRPFGELDHLPCSWCQHDAGSVHYTHPSEDRYCVWFVCTHCGHRWRAATLDHAPRIYTEDRIDRVLEQRDAEFYRR